MLAITARAQDLVPAADLPAAIHLFQANSKADDSLKCELEHLKPELDFAFRFNVRYMVACGLSQFQSEAGVGLYVRITPQQGMPLILRELYHLRPVSPELKAK